MNATLNYSLVILSANILMFLSFITLPRRHIALIFELVAQTPTLSADTHLLYL